MRLSPELMGAVTSADVAALTARDRWLDVARPNQIPPHDLAWTTLLWLAGRGYGKTRCLVEHGWFNAFRYPSIRVHALGPTIGDVRRVLFEGDSGFLQRMPRELLKNYNRSLHELTLINNSKIIGFSATEEADRLRGPQAQMLLFDEAAAADRPSGNLQTAYNTASLGCRLRYPDGTPSRKLIATTPRPIQFLRQLIKSPGVRVVRGSSYENFKNLAASAQDVIRGLEGTAFGKQEVHAEILDESEQAIFKRSWFRLWPPDKRLPEFEFVVVSMDTALEEEDYDKKVQEVDATAIGIWGLFEPSKYFNEAELKKYKWKGKYAVLLCDLIHERMGFPELLETSRKIARQRVGAKGGRRPDVLLIENKVSGISLRQSLAKYSLPVWPFNPGGQSKTMRAHAASPFVRQGVIWVPESLRPEGAGEPRDWAVPLVDQCCSFVVEGSGGGHDDAHDQMVQLVLYLVERGMLTIAPQDRPYPDAEEKQALDEREAAEIAKREKRQKWSPYGA